MVPNDLPPSAGVHQLTQRWFAAGCFEAVVHRGGETVGGEPGGVARGALTSDEVGEHDRLSLTLPNTGTGSVPLNAGQVPLGAVGAALVGVLLRRWPPS